MSESFDLEENILSLHVKENRRKCLIAVNQTPFVLKKKTVELQ